MAILLHQATAALYLLAGIVAWLGLALGARRLERGSVAILTLGGALHLVAFGTLHTLDPPPPLTDLPIAISFMACVGALFFLLLSQWARLAGLVVVVAPVAFVSAFAASLRMRHAMQVAFVGAGSWPHAHVLLASAGLACLGLAGLAGLLFLAEHRRLKAKKPLGFRFDLPSLEALDHVNRLSLAVGFPLLTLGVVTGVIWVDQVHGVSVNVRNPIPGSGVLDWHRGFRRELLDLKAGQALEGPSFGVVLAENKFHSALDWPPEPDAAVV